MKIVQYGGLQGSTTMGSVWCVHERCTEWIIMAVRADEGNRNVVQKRC